MNDQGRCFFKKFHLDLALERSTERQTDREADRQRDRQTEINFKSPHFHEKNKTIEPINKPPFKDIT
jgi:hypothetical protein